MNHSTALQILRTIQYATIATSDEQGNPWNTPVFCAFDDDSNIYWSSHPDSVHSLNIANNHKAFIVFYNSLADEGEGLGLYMSTDVRALEDSEEIKLALTLLGKRRGRPFLHIEKFIGSGTQRIYKAIPSRCWTNDSDQDEDGDFIKDYRIEIEL